MVADGKRNNSSGFQNPNSGAYYKIPHRNGHCCWWCGKAKGLEPG